MAKAVKGASEKAEVLAEASGKKLGDVVTIVEGYQNTDLEYRYLDAEALKNSDEAADAVIMPGETDVEANVTVMGLPAKTQWYSINDRVVRLRARTYRPPERRDHSE